MKQAISLRSVSEYFCPPNVCQPIPAGWQWCHVHGCNIFEIKQQLLGNCCNPTDATATQHLVHLWKHTVKHAHNRALYYEASPVYPILYSLTGISEIRIKLPITGQPRISLHYHMKGMVLPSQTWYVNSQQSSWFYSATPQPPMVSISKTYVASFWSYRFTNLGLSTRQGDHSLHQSITAES